MKTGRKDYAELPKNKDTLAQLIDSHMSREMDNLSYRWTMWRLLWEYVANGVRNFETFDIQGQRVAGSQLDADGSLEFQAKDLTFAINQNVGRMASLDLRPKVIREDASLQGIRERAIAQIVADAQVSKDQLRSVATQFFYIFTALGCCGLQGHTGSDTALGLATDLEVVHPTQIFPYPSLGYDYSKQRGLIRQRYVSTKFIKSVYGTRVYNENKNRMETYSVDPGDTLQDDAGGMTLGSVSTSTGSWTAWGKASPTTDGSDEVVRIREFWQLGAQNRVIRSAVTSGWHCFEDQDFSALETYCPLGVARFFENGTFHGEGLFDMMYSLVRNFELMLKTNFNNIREADKYGFVLLPQGTVNERQGMKEIGKGLRFLFWEQDPMAPVDARPIVVQPNNTGDVPGRTAAFANDLMGKLNPVRDLFAEKGRVDSASGLQFLDEQTNKALSVAGASVEQCFGGVWKYTTSQAIRGLLDEPRPIPVSRLTLDLAGAIIDTERNEVSFMDNPVPNISKLSFSVRETAPRSPVARKAEALENLKLGLTDPDGLKIFGFKEGLDFAMWTDEEQAAYESVQINILKLFGDGQTPGGPVIITEYMSRPDIQLRILNAFMASPKMMVASPEVQDEFAKYRETLMTWMGAVLPEAVPNPGEGPPLSESMQEATLS